MSSSSRSERPEYDRPEGTIPELTHDVGVWGEKEDVVSPTFEDQGISEEDRKKLEARAIKRFGKPKQTVSD